MKIAVEKLADRGFRKAFDSIDKQAVKREVDEKGLDKFIAHCAVLAGGTGALSGLGGPMTMLVGVPADIINNVVQQFRVTLAVIYSRGGSHEIEFEEFMRIVRLSLGLEVGMIMTRSIMVTIAEKVLQLIRGRVGRRLLPVVGAVVGASTNYMFIKRIGESVKQIELSPLGD